MLRLPTVIEVRLVDSRGAAARVADVLVAINLLAAGRYYYGNLLGLTDRAGVAGVSGEELELRYVQDQRRFPMDYKLELIECDSAIEVALLSGDEVASAKAAVADDFSITTEIRESYARARNALFLPALLRIEADSPDGDPLVLRLPLVPRA